MFSGAAGSGSAALALKCGKCVFAEKTKEDGSKCLVVTPTAAEKGELSIAQAGADGVVHLKWTHRETGAVEPDVMIFPDEWTFTAVDTGREKELVWLLQLSKNSKRRHFFWSLESDSDTAKDKAKALGKYLKEPSTIPAAGAGPGPGPGAGGAGGLPGGMSQAQLLQMLGGGAGGIDPALLQQLMGGAAGGAAGGAGGASGAASGGEAPSAAGDGAPAAPAAGGAVNGDDMRALLQSMQSSQGGDAEGSAAVAGGGGDEDDMEAAMLAAAIAASLAGGNAAGGDGANGDADDDGNADGGDSSNNDSAPPAAPGSAAATAAVPADAPAEVVIPASATPAVSATSVSPTPSGDLNAMMAAILGGAAMQQQMQQQQQQQPAPPVIAPLSDLLSSDDVGPLLEDDAVVAALLPHLPEGQQTAEELRRTLSTPQFRSTLRTLTSALMSDNYNSVMANFGLDPTAGSEALAQGNPVLAFLQALQAQSDQSSSSSSKENN